MTKNRKIALITGNRQGLGAALSKRVAELGYESPLIVKSSEFDLTKYEDCKALYECTIQKYNQIDLLVNCVGNYINKPISDFEPSEWNEMFSSNVNSAFYMSKLCLPELRKTQGRIINIGYAGLNKLSPSENVTAYQAAKTSLLVLTKGLAKSEAKNKVLINMLSPGYLENTVIDPIMPHIPLDRFASLEEACDTAMFLIESKYITGQNIDLAGGWNI